MRSPWLFGWTKSALHNLLWRTPSNTWITCGLRFLRTRSNICRGQHKVLARKDATLHPCPALGASSDISTSLPLNPSSSLPPVLFLNPVLTISALPPVTDLSHDCNLPKIAVVIPMPDKGHICYKQPPGLTGKKKKERMLSQSSFKKMGHAPNNPFPSFSESKLNSLQWQDTTVRVPIHDLHPSPLIPCPLVRCPPAILGWFPHWASSLSFRTYCCLFCPADLLIPTG